MRGALGTLLAVTALVAPAAAGARAIVLVANEAEGAILVREMAALPRERRVPDLTLVLARAVELAGSTDRRAIRDALERVRSVEGVMRRHECPFAPGRHEALTRADVFLARYGPDGGLDRIPR